MSYSHTLEPTPTGKFSWDAIYEQLDWLPNGGLNIAHETIDRHTSGPLKDKAALVWIGTNNERKEYTFSQLAELTNRFANLLKSLGIDQGDRICVSLENIPEFYVSILGVIKIGAVIVPVNSEANEATIKHRMLHTKAKILVTQPRKRSQLYSSIFEMFDLQHIIVVNRNNINMLPLDTADLDYDEEMDKASTDFSIATTSQYDYYAIHYNTEINGVVHSHLSIAQHLTTGRWAFDITEDDTIWSLDNPTTPYGISCGILAPWVLGAKVLVRPKPKDIYDHYAAIEKHRVSILHAPTDEILNMHTAGKGIVDDYNIKSLKHVSTISESIHSTVIERTTDMLNKPVFGSWLQPETGTVVTANSNHLGSIPGSIGRAVPGIKLATLDDKYHVKRPGIFGLFAIRPDWPSMFINYWDNSKLYKDKFRRGWYITSRTAAIDDKGFVWLQD